MQPRWQNTTDDRFGRIGRGKPIRNLGNLGWRATTLFEWMESWYNCPTLQRSFQHRNAFSADYEAVPDSSRSWARRGRAARRGRPTHRARRPSTRTALSSAWSGLRPAVNASASSVRWSPSSRHEPSALGDSAVTANPDRCVRHVTAPLHRKVIEARMTRVTVMAAVRRLRCGSSEPSAIPGNDPMSAPLAVS